MKALVVIHDHLHVNDTLAYAQKLSAKGDEIHILGLVSASGDIPKKRSGEVIDGCTEFDLTPLSDSKSRILDAVAKESFAESASSRQVLIGNPMKITQTCIAELSPDYIITATELTNEGTDLWTSTHAGNLLKHADLPVISFKCARAQEPIIELGIVSDYTHPEEANLKLVKHIAEHSGAQIALYGFIYQASEKSAMEAHMGAFAVHHALTVSKQTILSTQDIEGSVQDLLTEHPISLLVLTDIHRHGRARLLKGDLEHDILNHTANPILAY